MGFASASAHTAITHPIMRIRSTVRTRFRRNTPQTLSGGDDGGWGMGGEGFVLRVLHLRV